MQLSYMLKNVMNYPNVFISIVSVNSIRSFPNTSLLNLLFGVSPKRIFRKTKSSFQGLTTSTDILNDSNNVLSQLYDHYRFHFLHPPLDSNFSEVLNEYQLLINSLSTSTYIPLTTTFDEIREAMSSLQPKLSFDLYNNSNLMFKRLPPDVISILTLLFNFLLATSYFPDFCKSAKIICLSKTASFPSIDDLRPISLLCVLGKLFERIIGLKLKRWMRDSAIIPPEQSGFQPQLRLAKSVLTLIEAHRAALSSNRLALTFYLDFKSAFDKISPFSLLVKLNRQDLPHSLLFFLIS